MSTLTFYRRFRKRVYQIVELAEDGDKSSHFFDLFIFALILLNIFAVVLETMAPVYRAYRQVFDVFEMISIGIFTIEYLLRLISCVENPAYRRPIMGRLRYLVSFMAVVDLLAILPGYLPMFIFFDLRTLRVFRLLRFLRITKITRYTKSVNLILRVLKNKAQELAVVMFLLFLLLILSSSLLYFIENPYQPDVFSSIPAAMWWGICTLSTVGYGDMIPITAVGKIMGAIISLLGIGFFALPTGILGSAFIEEMQKSKTSQKSICPHCGKEID
ncbi:MAG TPA: ion transporter [bacterium]|mgnify:CR=1 FL=1|nr:ion transporter [bacterium]